MTRKRKPILQYLTIAFLSSFPSFHFTNGAVPTIPRISRNFLENFNVSTELQHDLLLKTVIPSYLTEFIQENLANLTSSEPLQSSWLDGVEWDCKVQILDWLARLNIDHWNDIIKEDQKWVLQMIDAWGKIPEGIMSGHVHSYGDYDQCVQTQADVKEVVIPDAKTGYSFSGMYCNVYLAPLDPTSMSSLTLKHLELKNSKIALNYSSQENNKQESVSVEELINMMLTGQNPMMPMLPTIGTCFPNTCTQSDIFVIFMNVMKDFYSRVPVDNPVLYLVPVSCTDRHQPSLDAASICVITLLAILVGLALIAGILDYWQRNYKPDSTIRKNKAYSYLMAFSIYTNTKKLLGTHRGSEDLSCLHGIRFFSTAWVVLGHTYATFMQGPQWNLVDMGRVQDKWTEIAVLNGTFSVDTFFLMSGMLATYNLFKLLDKTKGKLNIIMLYVHRYIRLTPCYAILIGINATLLKYAFYGPMGFVMQTSEDYCKTNWWKNLLYINNLVDSDKMCNAESWYLANDMQFFILSPFIVYPIWKWEKIGSILLTLYTILSCIAPVLVVRYARDAPPAILFTRPEGFGAGFGQIYIKPWSRISTFLVGVWLGWILYKTRGRKINIKRPTVLLLWFASAGITLAVIFGITPWFDPATPIPEVGGYFYAGLSKLTFAVGVSWVIFACLKGYGGIVNEFLSWKAFMPLGRLCFSVYLVSFHLQGIFHTRLTVPIKWETYMLVNLFFAHMVMSYFVGFLCTLLFESPFIIVQKLIFESPPASQKKLPSSGVASKATEGGENNNNNLSGVKVSTE